MTFNPRDHALKLAEENDKYSLKRAINKFLRDKFDIYHYKDLIPFRYWMLYTEKIRPIWSPSHSRIRKAIPRSWMDVSTLIENVNFEFIKSFYEEEYKADTVDWEASSEKHAEFARWLEASYKYITDIRPTLEKQMWDSYPPTRSISDCFSDLKEDNYGRKYYEWIPSNADYSEVNRLEKLIEDTDTKLLTEFIQYRQFFWT
jgi:hypothetical protein